MTPTTRPIVISLYNNDNVLMDWDVFRSGWTLSNDTVFGIKELYPGPVEMSTTILDEYALYGGEK